MTRKASIYLLTCRPNGKQYVGMTFRGIAARWQQHINSSRSGANCCPVLANAIRKHGAENFNVQLILECDEDRADDYEKMMIEMYDCKIPQGYNITDGGRRGHNGGRQKDRLDHKGDVLPMYVHKLASKRNPKYDGYQVRYLPHRKNFSSQSVSMDQRLEDAKTWLQHVLDGTSKEDMDVPEYRKKRKIDDDVNLPKYIIRVKTTSKNTPSGGFMVSVSSKKISKWFTSAKYTMPEKLQMAKNYLQQLKDEGRI